MLGEVSSGRTVDGGTPLTRGDLTSSGIDVAKGVRTRAVLRMDRIAVAWVVGLLEGNLQTRGRVGNAPKGLVAGTERETSGSMRNTPESRKGAVAELQADRGADER